MAKSCDENGCMNCMYNFGAVKHFCNKRGGDAEFEPSGGWRSFNGKQSSVMGWEPHTLDQGPIQNLPDNWPGKYYENGIHKVRIKDQGHEKATMEAMGCHFGERGEKVSGHDLMLKGRPRFGSKSFSFIGSNRKASTCR
jgi:hypothetical protein